jgi:hypothetical protein
MSDYRISRRTHWLEPTIDWQALLVLSISLSAAICIAMVILR